VGFEIATATEADVQRLTALINSAFALEKFFVSSDRTTPDQIRGYLSTGTFLVVRGRDADLAACVYLERRGDRAYVGMLSVDPSRQKTGLGRLMMDAAERYGVEHGRSRADITVVSVRPELLPFYRKLGYVEDGVEPFPDPAALTRECHLIKMWKALV